MGHVRDENKIPEIVSRIEGLAGKTEISDLSELFPLEFIRRHTSFQSIDELLDAAGLPENADLDNLDLIQMESLDEAVKNKSRYSCWSELLDFAEEEWVKRRIDV